MGGDCDVFVRGLRRTLQDADNSKADRSHITGIERLVAGVYDFGGSGVQVEAKQSVFETLPFLVSQMTWWNRPLDLSRVLKHPMKTTKC